MIIIEIVCFVVVWMRLYIVRVVVHSGTERRSRVRVGPGEARVEGAKRA